MPGSESRPERLPVSTPTAIHPWVAEGECRVRFGVFGGPLADWPALRDWAQLLERVGFDSLWIGDHTMLFAVDCWTALSALAVHTTSLRLGPLVSCVYYRPPALLARMAADVDRFSGGRLVLGLGVGDLPKEFAQIGVAEPSFRERAVALEETVGLVRGLWGEEPVTMHGRFVHADDARLASRPVQQPHVPLLIAGGGEKVTLKQVARHADMCNFGPSEAYGSAWGVEDVRRKLEALRRHCDDVGRPYQAVLRSHFGGLVLGATEEEVEAKLARRPNRAQMTEAQREPGLPRVFTSHYRYASVEHLASTTVVGTPVQLAEYYRRLVDAGMRYFVVSGLDTESARLFAGEVIPRVTDGFPTAPPASAEASGGV